MVIRAKQSLITDTKDLVHLCNHLLLVFLKRTRDWQVVGGVSADKLQIVHGDIFKNLLHLSQGFKGIEQLKFSVLYLTIQNSSRHRSDGQGCQITGLYLITDFGRGKRMSNRGLSRTRQSQKNHDG